MKHLMKSFLPLLIVGALVLTLQACSKKDSSSGNHNDDGGGDDYSLTTPAPHRGDAIEGPEPFPTPQVSDVYAPFTGVWKESYLGKTLVFLPDGRVAYKPDGQPADLGILVPTSTANSFDIRWLQDDVESTTLGVSGNTLSFGLSLNFDRIGEAGDAEAAYNEIYNELQQYAETNDAKYPVGSITNTVADKHDPKPNSVLPGAKVFTTGIHFQASFTESAWFDMPDGTIEGFDGYPRTDVWLMPNGRFFMQMWIWDHVNPRSRMDSYRNYQSWGKYTVIKGNDAITGDIINCYYDNGGSAAYKTVAGQTCFLVQGITYHNK